MLQVAEAVIFLLCWDTSIACIESGRIVQQDERDRFKKKKEKKTLFNTNYHL